MRSVGPSSGARLRRLEVHGLLLLASASIAIAAQAPPRVGDLTGADPLVQTRIEEVLEAVEREPFEAARWLELGKVYHAHQFTDPAAECYRRASELAPEEPRGWYFLAHAEAELGRLVEAVGALEQVNRLADDYVPAYWRRGDWLRDLGRSAEAEAAYRSAVRRDDTSAAGWIGLARIALDRGEARGAAEILQRVFNADPTNGVAGQLLGGALHALGDEDGARRALALTTGAGAYFSDPWYEEILWSATGLGNVLRLLSARMDRGDVDGVIAELEELRADHPRDVGVLNKLSEGHLHRRDPEAALEVLEIAYEVDPHEYATLIHIGQGRRMLGDLAGALEWTDRAIVASPTSWQAHFERAATLHSGGSFSDCVAALDEAMRLGGHQNPNVWLMRGDAYIRSGDWEGAVATFEPASRRFPFLAQAFIGLAIAQVERGRAQEARAALAEAGRLQPEDETMAMILRRIEELETGGSAEGSR